ncbi:MULTISPECIES: HNH endonuclease [Bacillaceae]|uniref:HNH endonuclease n=1 Tax=Evansella alkalicola TaxID=745819 RepID=A0ABS6JY43_9BACI|nr:MULTISPECIES: HNH endonuclease [Bacillaceae]MBU9723516.1 HNH endonuclease [Bacillus alkalicola]
MSGKDKWFGYVKSGVEKTKAGAKKLYTNFDEKDRQLKTTTGKGSLHSFGEKAGDTVGKGFSIPLNYLANKTNTPYVGEVGDSLHGATKFSAEAGSQVAQGVYKTLQGSVTKDFGGVKEGFGEFTAVGGRTVGAFVKTASFTLKNSTAVVKGFYHKDYDVVKTGLKGVGKVIIVGAVAVTVFDLIEGDDVSAATDGDFLMTHNSHLDGQHHPTTGVFYEAQTVELENGAEVVGVFPVFEGVADVYLPEEMYQDSDYLHFSYANQQLVEMVNADPSLANEFTGMQLEQIYAGETPDGFTWHHHEDLGRIQLVDEEIHAKSGHSGGRTIWGGGSDAR